MGLTTPIEWTDATWNPVRGCSRVSEGCRNCYAERTAARFAGDGDGDDNKIDQVAAGKPGPFHGFVHIVNGHPAWTGKVELVEKHLADPLKWKKPKRIFVNSMSDLFHEGLSDEAIDRVFAVMALCPQHTFQILTKRPARMRRYLAATYAAIQADWCFPKWPLTNVQLGVSVEDKNTADERIPLLLQTPAAVRFVSYEPALGPVDFGSACARGAAWGLDPFKPSFWRGKRIARAIEMIDWIIVGGESGPGARPFDIAWARNTVAQCKAAGVACFVKQMGAFVVSSETQDWVGHRGLVAQTGRGFEECWRIELKDRKGGDWNEWPADLRVREFPEGLA